MSLIVSFCNDHQVLNFVKLIVDHVFEKLVVSTFGLNLSNLKLLWGDRTHDLVCLNSKEPCIDLACSIFKLCREIVIQRRAIDDLIAIRTFKLI